MDPVTPLFVLGVLGGVGFAIILRRLNRRSVGRPGAATGEPISTDVINIARIRVAGVGGLGLVAMAVAVAVAIPEIGRSLGIGLVLGAALAAGLIAFRRSAGPLPSSAAQPGANTTLSIDSDEHADQPR